jgi:hypothetical protein
MDEKMTWLPMWQHFFEEEFSRGQPQSLGQETWPPENSNLNKILSKYVLFSTFQGYFILFFPLDLQEKNHVAPKKKGELWASPRKL